MRMNKKGFTLIELMVVVAIIATVVFAMTQSPQFQNYRDRLASTNSAKILGADLRLCQQRCLEREEVWGILIIDAANGKYRVFNSVTTSIVKNVNLSDMYNTQVRFMSLSTGDVIKFDPASTDPRNLTGNWSVVTPKLNDVTLGAGGNNINLSAGNYTTTVTIQQNGVVSY